MPDNKINFDNYTDNYNQLLREGTGFFTSNEEYFARYKVELVSKHLASSPERLLEYGCGIGRNIPFLRQAFSNSIIIGSDISRASLDIARTNNPGVCFELEDDNARSSASGPFDLIFVAGVFHHIPPDQRPNVALSLFARLTPGGNLFIFEHNPYNPVTRRIVSNCPYDGDAVLLKPLEMKQILGNAGLAIKNAAYCLFVPPRLSVLSGVEQLLGWLPLGGQYWVQASRPL